MLVYDLLYDSQTKAGAFGLMGMRERILPLSGQCEIQGTPGRGTTVRVSVPLEVPQENGQ